jgi:hypothetical protein
MSRFPVVLLLVALLVPAGAPVEAQTREFELPEYTDQQRWNRLAFGLVSFQAALLELGKKHGMSPEEVGAFTGEFFSSGWLAGIESTPFAVALNRNHMGYPNATAEVVSYDDWEVEVRFNRPWEEWVGLDRQMMAITSDEFLAMQRGLHLALSERVGITTTWDEDGDHDVLTLRTDYGPITADDNLRYGRMAYLGFLTSTQLLDEQMKRSGLSARDLGLQQGDLFAPSWGSVTPWGLFRGMTWNALAWDRTYDCEVVSASPEEVNARCTHTFEQRIGQVSGYFDVTVDDLLENLRGFAERVAEHRGMRWEETWEPGVRIIRVTMR